jgi:hypothetical protein
MTGPGRRSLNRITNFCILAHANPHLSIRIPPTTAAINFLYLTFVKYLPTMLPQNSVAFKISVL